MTSAVGVYIDEHREDVADLLSELVRIRTVNPPGENYEAAVALLESHCASLGMATSTVDVPPQAARRVLGPHAAHPRRNLIARLDLGQRRTIHFNSHFDVVPVSGGWRVEPFSGERRGDWLYGRGADDMKDSIAATLLAVRAIVETGVQTAANVECSFTVDEETGGQLGAGYLARKGLIRGDCVVNCEGGGGLTVGYGHNGVLWLRVTVHGKAAHASVPHEGVNAFERMSALVQALEPLKERLRDPERCYVTESGIRRQPTVNVGGVFAGSEGDKENTVPALASFTIDRRVVPNESIEDAEAELRAAIEDARRAIPGIRVDVERTLAIEPCLVDANSRCVQEFARVVRQVRRRPVKLSTTSGFTDLHYLVGRKGLPGVGYGPIGEGGHGANERVRISEVAQTARIYAEFIRTADFG
ncbi:ArgE/DapE family deacylase [Candidatus Poribacteria bacterium]|nr:ArgE/DapE family deacylase [Candidatus Poribacteria bacterium]